MQSSHTLFENGEMALTLPTAALSPPLLGCVLGSLKCETEIRVSTLKALGMTMTLDTCPEGGTCPRLKHTCVSLRMGDENRVGGKRTTEPPKRRNQVTTSKRMKLTQAYVT